MMAIIPRTLWLADNNYSKQSQLARSFGVSRDPHELRALLCLQMPKTLEESRAERFKKCAVPTCFAHGTVENPLDLHHVVPRSQSKSLIDEFTNHLYLCGDFFQKNHHKALHGNATPGRKDWEKLGVIPNVMLEKSCESEKTISLATLEEACALIKLTDNDQVARNLLKKNILLATQYAVEKGVLHSVVAFSGDTLKTIILWQRERRTWNPLHLIR